MGAEHDTGDEALGVQATGGVEGRADGVPLDGDEEPFLVTTMSHLLYPNPDPNSNPNPNPNPNPDDKTPKSNSNQDVTTVTFTDGTPVTFLDDGAAVPLIREALPRPAPAPAPTPTPTPTPYRYLYLYPSPSPCHYSYHYSYPSSYPYSYPYKPLYPCPTSTSRWMLGGSRTAMCRGSRTVMCTHGSRR